MKIHYLIFAFVFALLGVSTDIDAQSSKKKKRRPATTTEEEKIKPGFAENMTYDIKAGNISLGGNLFSLALKGEVGYHLTDFLSAGLAAKYGLVMFNLPGQSQDKSIGDYGFGPYLRAKIFNQFFLQLEYDINGIPIDANGIPVVNFAQDVVDRSYVGSPYLGGGYLQGWGDWQFGIELLFILDNEIRDYQNSFVEYWIGASYNF